VWLLQIVRSAVRIMFIIAICVIVIVSSSITYSENLGGIGDVVTALRDA
jgi:hypothetical protein